MVSFYLIWWSVTFVQCIYSLWLLQYHLYVHLHPRVEVIVSRRRHENLILIFRLFITDTRIFWKLTVQLTHCTFTNISWGCLSYLDIQINSMYSVLVVQSVSKGWRPFLWSPIKADFFGLGLWYLFIWYDEVLHSSNAYILCDFYSIICTYIFIQELKS